MERSSRLCFIEVGSRDKCRERGGVIRHGLFMLGTSVSFSGAEIPPFPSTAEQNNWCVINGGLLGQPQISHVHRRFIQRWPGVLEASLCLGWECVPPEEQPSIGARGRLGWGWGRWGRLCTHHISQLQMLRNWHDGLGLSVPERPL